MIPRDEAIEFLETAFKQWLLVRSEDPEVARKFATAAYDYLMTASYSPQGLIRHIEQKNLGVVNLYSGEGE